MNSLQRAVFIAVSVWAWLSVCGFLGLPVFWAVDALDRGGRRLSRRGLIGWGLLLLFIATGLGMVAGSVVTLWAREHPL